MKKIIYLICSGLIAFTSCDPMEDVYQELDAQKDAGLYNKDMALTLTTANYQSLKGKTGVPSYVNNSFYFATEEEAATLIPLYLNAAFPQLDNGSSAAVTYNQLVFDFTNNTVASTPAPLPVYTLVDEDYTGAGTTYKNLNISNNDAEVIRFLNYKYPAPVANQLAVFTFNAYNSRVSSSSPATTDSYYYKNGSWVNAYHVSAEDYTAVNRGRYKNFESIDDASLPVYFNKFLANVFLNPKTGDVQYVSYNYRAGSINQQRIMTMTYNGSAWVEVKQDITKPASLTFAKKDGQWAPDLTIKLTLAEADYLWIADDANGIGTVSNRANLKSFKNFYQQTNDDRYWSDAQIQAGLAARLKVLYPNAEVGQKYKVSYTIYNSGAQTRVLTFIKDASGNYVVFNG